LLGNSILTAFGIPPLASPPLPTAAPDTAEDEVTVITEAELAPAIVDVDIVVGAAIVIVDPIAAEELDPEMLNCPL
jgi:hypothetical protein